MTGVDVVVVGAGPAGSATAISLAERGRRVLLLDKATFPRDKVCGDFLSPRSLAVLAELGCHDALRRAQPRPIRRSAIHLNGELLSAGPVPQAAGLPDHGLVVPRMVADEILVRRAAAAGAEVVEGFTATGLTVRGDGVTVHGHRPTGAAAVDGRLAVVADGARSQLAAGLGLPVVSGQKHLFALRAYLRDVPGPPDTAGIFFDADFFPGYAWVFPTGDGGANVGMGMQLDTARRYGINLRERFVHWLSSDSGARALLGTPVRHDRIVGWPLPSYQGAHGNYADRVLVVGDAGWFIDPLNGEGIHTALESARLAASVADEALTTGDLGAGALRAYERRWRARFDLDLRSSDLMVTIAQNRDLLPLWLLVIRMATHRATLDPDFAATWGGIMAGVVPTHRGLSPELVLRTVVQSPGFWLRHQAELLRVLEALAGRGAGGAAPPAGWMREVLAKWTRVSDGLTTLYGVPWTTGRRVRDDPADPPPRPLPTIVLGP